MHVSAGLHEEFTRQMTLKMELVLRGNKKDAAKSHPQHPRLPITMEIMVSIKIGVVERSVSLFKRDATGYMWPHLFRIPQVWGIYCAFSV